MMQQKISALLNADQSVWDWLRRHGLYWFVFVWAATLLCVYWWGDSGDAFKDALVAVLFRSLVLYMPTTYLLLYFVLPKLLVEQYSQFVVRLLFWVGFSFTLRYLIIYKLAVAMTSSAPADSPLRQLFDGSFLVTNNFVIVAAALKLFRYGYLQEKARQQLAQETLSAALQLLKAQVHPHFLFNTLNNIYSLTLRRSAQAGQAVQKLAGLLRYMFQETETPWVSLRQEIQLLQDYIELEQLRYSHRLSVTLTTEGNVDAGQVAPLLLLPFVENAFKHGASEQTEQAVITIEVRVTDYTLHFSMMNSTHYTLPDDTGKVGGLGLQNVRKRLQLLYPNQHTLTIHSEDRQYSVILSLPIIPIHDSSVFGNEWQEHALFKPTIQVQLGPPVRP